MDSGKFLESLRCGVSDVRATQVALEITAGRPQSAENLRAVIGQRRYRDALGSLIAANPEEFAGLLVALADRVEHLSERLDNAGVV